MQTLELHDYASFVVCSRGGTQMTMSNMRRAVQGPVRCGAAGFGSSSATVYPSTYRGVGAAAGQGSGAAPPVGASCDDDAVSTVPHPDRVGLATVLAQVPGKWVAVDLDTNEPRVVADSPAEMVAAIRRSGIHNVAVVRAPEPDEPQLVGLG